MTEPRLIEIARAGSHEQCSGAAAARLYYCAETREWSLWWPCARCGGSALPMLAEIAPAGLSAALAHTAAHIAAQPCPGCLSAESRASGRDPLAWYDTAVAQWVVRVPRGEHALTIVPLGIRWYDVPRALVNIAAARVFDAGF